MHVHVYGSGDDYNRECRFPGHKVGLTQETLLNSLSKTHAETIRICVSNVVFQSASMTHIIDNNDVSCRHPWHILLATIIIA